MDNRYLTTFLTVCSTHGYQQAAQQLQYAPSTLFKHIQLLEEELGYPLFIKSGKGLQLTDEGEQFKPIAEKILQSYRAALEIGRTKPLMNGSIAIGGCEMNTANSLLSLLTSYSAVCPQVHCSMVTSPNVKVPEFVRSGLVDVGFFYSPVDYPLEGLESAALYKEPLYVMCAPSHRFAGQPGVTLSDLAGAQIVHPHDSCCFIQELSQRMSRRHLAPSTVVYTGSVRVEVEHILGREFLGLIPYSAAIHLEKDRGLVRLPILDEPMYFWEMMLYKNYGLLSAESRSLVRHSLSMAARRLDEDSEQILVASDRKAV